MTSALIEAHPYEEVAYDILKLENMHPGAGSGLLGTLPEPVGTMELLKRLRETFRAEGIRHTAPHADNISRVALCGGSGSFLLPAAIRCGADMFITADLKYHQFFDADGRIVVADIGHYESEQYTSELIYDILSQKFGNFALHLTKINTNPINYL